MHSRVKQWSLQLLGISFLIALGWVLYTVGTAGLRYLTRLESDVAVAIVAAAATVFVSVLTLVLSKRQETESRINQELRSKKVPIYEDLIQTLFRMTYAEKLGEEPLSEQELLQFFVQSTQQMVVWGSDELIVAYRKFRMHFVEGKPMENPIDSIFQLEDLLLAIRKDLGHKNRGLTQGVVLGLWVNDVDKYVRLK